MAGHIADAGNLDWCTPDWILELVRKVFNRPIDLDPCWNPNAHTNAVQSYTLPTNDGLADTWDFPTVFVNPPYGVAYIHKTDKSYLSAKEFRAQLKALPKEPQAAFKAAYRRDTIGAWVDRCAKAHLEHGSEVIALIPCYPDTKVWQQTIRNTATAVCELRGRVAFRLVGSTRNTPAPMAVAVVYWGKNPRRFTEVFQEHGTFKYPQVDVLSLQDQVVIMRALLQDLYDTAQESRGIAGWHPNGDLMTWDEYGLAPVRAALQGEGIASLTYLRALEVFHEHPTPANATLVEEARTGIRVNKL